MGALGVALGTMVANLSSHKKGWDDRWKEYSDLAAGGKEIQNRLVDLVDEDTDAFNRIMEAYRLPKKTEEEIKIRKAAVQEAVKIAILVPFRVMETAYSAFPLIRQMVAKGNPASVTDAAVGALALRSCIKGAFLNVRINATSLDDKTFVSEILKKGSTIESNAQIEETAILKMVDDAIDRQS
jgi:glutamate formiminotransferase/formiminotetrahydrofolate cyclodeaminase